MVQNRYESFLSNLFSNDQKYLVGRELNELLQKQFKITSDNSRKIIQRAAAKGIIKSSSPLTFGKGQYVYLNTGITLNKEAVKEITKKYRPPIFRLLSLIDLNQGIISINEAMKVTSCIIEECSTKVNTLADIMIVLKKMNLISEITILPEERYLIDPKKLDGKDELIEKHKTKMYLDAVFLSDILRWLTKHNLIDNKNVRFRNKSNPSISIKHNNLVWDAFAYTKTTGINTNGGRKANDTEDKQTLVVLDVIVSRPYTDEDLQGFLSRIQIVINSVDKGVRKIMPVVVYSEISIIVRNKLAKLGFITISLGTVFGESIFEIIKKLEIIKSEKQLKLNNPEQFLENIENVLANIQQTGQGQNLENIKGDLFEALIYQLLSCIYPNAIIEQGKILKIKNSEEVYEYDFIIISPNYKEIIIAEAKGYKSTSFIKLGDRDKKNTAMWFFKRTFPFAKKYYKHNPIYPFPVKGCYITTASFEPDAIICLDELNSSKIKPSQLDSYYDGKKLIDLIDLKGLSKIHTLIKRYYSNESIWKFPS
ncbi:MAG: hypothetical protein JJE17_00065 [Peptostreptococcaceae bacterium]|nr:hypothetical protein [Peptostreptococcaceae bacterium]